MSLYNTLFEKQENKMKTGIVGMIIITAILAGVFNYEANAIPTANLEDLEDLVTTGEQAGNLVEFSLEVPVKSGYTSENSETDEKITIDTEKLLEVSCTLTWSDEDSQYTMGTNDPDEFKVMIIAHNDETMAESEFSEGGSVSTKISLPDYNEKDFVDNYMGDWIIRVIAGQCGDDSALIPLVGLRTTEDTGNAWELECTYKYMDYEEQSENSE